MAAFDQSVMQQLKQTINQFIKQQNIKGQLRVT